MNQIIKLTPENIASEHICCGFADKKCIPGYEAKKKWLSGQFEKSHTFKKMDIRGKVFIEYCPVEEAWYPIEAEGYMMISCFWVSGQYAGHGLGKSLLMDCISDSADKKGIIAITGEKKRPFLNDSKFLKKFGFKKVDSAPPYFELWCIKNDPNAPDPKFFNTAKTAECENKNGIVINYTDTCPFNDYYINVFMKDYAAQRNLPIEINRIQSREEALKNPVPFTINSIFYNGKFVTHIVKADKDIDKLL